MKLGRGRHPGRDQGTGTRQGRHQQLSIKVSAGSYNPNILSTGMVPEILPEFAEHYNLNGLKEFPKNFVRPCYFWFIFPQTGCHIRRKALVELFWSGIGLSDKVSVSQKFVQMILFWRM